MLIEKCQKKPKKIDTKKSKDKYLRSVTINNKIIFDNKTKAYQI